MNVRTNFARLACAAVLALAAPALHAAPAVNMFVSPSPIATGGVSTLFLTLYDDASLAFTGGSLSITYPAGVTNVGGVYLDNCGGTTVANPGSGVLTSTNISVGPSSNCQIYIDITASTAGSLVIDAPPGSLTSSSPIGSSASDVNATLTVIDPLMVTTNADSGAGSLRDALATANGSCTAALEIHFNIPGPGPHTIQPATPLPPVTCSGLVIDGFSQPGASVNTQGVNSGDNANLQIILNGTGCLTCNGLSVSSSNNVGIRGLAIHSFQGAGIDSSASSVYINGNYIGTDPGGMTALGNAAGIHTSGNGYVFVGSQSPQDHNLVTANGIGIHSESGALVTNSQIGGRRDGSLGMGNTGRGVFYNASNYTSQSVEASLVIGNGAQGISVDSATFPRVRIQGVVAYANGGIGIDLGDDGPTANDEAGPPYDTDSGPNRLLNYPVITSVTFDGFNTTINGYIKSEPNSDVQVYLYTNGSVTANTQGQSILDVFGGTLDASGFMAITRVYGGSYTNISAQMTADICGDGCVYSSEFSPTVAAGATMNCSMATQIPATGDGIVVGSTVIVPPGAGVTLFPLCFTSPTTFAWSNGATGFQTSVTAPAAGATATYTVDVSDGTASGTFSVTLQGALAGTPQCTLSTSPSLPMTTTPGTPFTITASCSPAATSFNWPNYSSGATIYVSGQGTASATYQVGTPEPGVGYHIQMDPANAAGPGPSSVQIIWFEQVRFTAPSSMNFGTIAAGTQSAAQTVTVTNLSSVNSASFPSATLTGPYTATNNCPSPLPPSATCTIDIRFAPTTAGLAQTGTAALTYSFPGNPTTMISLTGDATGAPGVMFTPASLAFAARTVLTTSFAQTLTLTNNGTATLGISSIAIAGDFAFTTGCAATLSPGTSCTIDVTFTPLVVGARNGTLTVTDNASGTPHVVALTGTGLSTAAAVLEVSPGVLDFSPQPVGSDSAPQAVIVSNSGTAPLTFTSIGITGEFSIVPPPAASTPGACPVTLLPGGSCRIDVRFHPTGFNTRSGSLGIATNGGSVALPLVGTGMVPEPPQLQTPVSLDFGTRPVGTRSAGQPAALHNVSPYVASVTELAASGDFAVSDTCTTIAIGATCSPQVTFQPTAVGPREGTLTVRTLRDVDPYTIRLTGNGIENLEPALEVSVTQVGFGNAFVGQHITREITLRNVGQAVLQVAGILAGSDFLTTGACVGPIAPNASCTLGVTFAPSGSGGRGGQLQILSNAPDSPHFVTLSGTGCFVPSPGRARFGMLLCGP